MIPVDQDAPTEPCIDFCPTVALSDEKPLDVCQVCGSLWRRQKVTEIDPVTFQPTRTQMASVRL